MGIIIQTIHSDIKTEIYYYFIHIKFLRRRPKEKMTIEIFKPLEIANQSMTINAKKRITKSSVKHLSENKEKSVIIPKKKKKKKKKKVFFTKKKKKKKKKKK